MSSINPLTAVVPTTPVPVFHANREEREHNLRVDQIVQASVAEGGQEKILLDLGDERLWVETRVPLKTGQQLSLQVLATDPRLELKLVEDRFLERVGRLLPLLGEKFDLGGLLQKLFDGAAGTPFAALLQGKGGFLEVFRRLADPGSGIDGRALESLFRHLGLDLEGRLAKGGEDAVATTAKGLLLQVLQALEEKGGNTARAVQRGLEGIELYQLCGVRLAEDGILLLPLPLSFVESGFLTMERHSPETAEGDGEEGGYLRLSLHLALQGLGDFQADLLLDAQGLLLRLLCDSPSKAAFLAGFRDELEEALAFLPLRGLTFGTGAENPAKVLIPRVWQGGAGMLDTRV